MGNLRSVERALAFLGHPCRVQPKVDGASRLIIPGVGAFGAAMEALTPLAESIRDAAQRVPTLGICLGMQLFFESSEESPGVPGLSLLPGTVERLPKGPGIKVPHMGWNTLAFRPRSRMGASFPADGQVYFVHAYHCVCAHEGDVAAWSDHGGRFVAAVEREHLWGTQFHPEKSGDLGLELLSRFLAL